MQENQDHNPVSTGLLATNQAKPDSVDKEECLDVSNNEKSWASNRIKPNYSVTPSLENVFRKRYADEAMKLTEDYIQFEESASERDTLKQFQILIQCVHTHRWEVRRDLGLTIDQPTKTFLKDLHFGKDTIFRHLRGLMIFLKAEDVSSHTFTFFTSKTARHLGNLQKLSLCFFECPEFTSENLRILGREVSQNLFHLTDLALEFYQNENINDEDVKSLVSPICRYMRKLKSLSIWFAGCDSISDESLKSTGYLIGHGLPQLQSVQLHFGSCSSSKISDSGVQTLMFHLTPLRKSLHELILHLNYLPLLSDEALRISSDHLKTFSSLSSLSLDFSYCHKISDQGFGFLSSCITNNLVDLKKLSLNLSNCDDISDEGLKMFDLHLLSNLTELRLHFSKSCGITEKGFESMPSKLTQLSHLKNLDLAFTFLEQITDKSLEVWKNEFARFEMGWEGISLNISGCKMITDKGLEDIVSTALNSFKSLKTASFYLIGSQVTQDAIGKAKEALSHLSRVYIC